MAKTKSNPREDAILKLQDNVAKTAVKLALEKKPEIGDSKTLGEFFATTPGSKLIKNIVSVEAEERAKIDLYFQAPYLVAVIKKCNYCKNRGFTGMEVTYQKHANGYYVRDENGKPILASSTPRICKCVNKVVETLKESTIIKWAIDEYDRQEKQKAKETAGESEPATEEGVTKAKPKSGSRNISKTPTREGKETAK